MVNDLVILYGILVSLAYMIIIGHKHASTKSIDQIRDRALSKYRNAKSREDKDEILSAWEMFVATRPDY